MAKFKQEILEIMKTDPQLFALLSESLKVKPTALPQTISRNGKKLNEYSIVILVAKHLNKDPEDIVENEPSKVKEAQN